MPISQTPLDAVPHLWYPYIYISTSQNLGRASVLPRLFLNGEIQVAPKKFGRIMALLLSALLLCAPACPAASAAAEGTCPNSEGGNTYFASGPITTTSTGGFAPPVAKPWIRHLTQAPPAMYAAPYWGSTATTTGCIIRAVSGLASPTR